MDERIERAFIDDFVPISLIVLKMNHPKFTTKSLLIKDYHQNTYIEYRSRKPSLKD